MNDTSPEMEEVYRKLLMSKSGSERLHMASDMFEFARTLVRSSLRHHNYSKKELEWQVFLRMYKRDFDQSTLDKIYVRYYTTGHLVCSHKADQRSISFFYPEIAVSPSS